MDDLDQLFAASIAKINYQGKDAETISCKAKEVLRLINMKLPHGSLRKAESVRPLLALDISLRLLAYAYNKNALLVSISPKDYNEAITICKNVLKLSWDSNITIDSLSIQFECESIVSFAYQIVNKLKELAEIRCGNCVYTSFDTPLFHSAAFFLAARHNKISVRQKSVVEAAEIDERVFRDLCEHLKSEIKVLTIAGDAPSSSSLKKNSSSRGGLMISKGSSEDTPVISVERSEPVKSATVPKAPINRVENISKFIDDLKAINNSDTGDSLITATSNQRNSPNRSAAHNNHRRSLLERKETLQEERLLRKKRNREIYEQFALEIISKHGLKSYVPIE